jgi:hypothetical protein
VNFALSNLFDLRKALHAPSTSWEAFVQLLDLRIDALSHRQASTVYWEAYCGFVVYGTELYRAVNRRDQQRSPVEYAPIRPDAALRECQRSSS